MLPSNLRVLRRASRLAVVWAACFGAALAWVPQSQRDALDLRAAVEANDWRRIVEIGEGLEERGAGDAVLAFDLARAHAQLGGIETAMAWFEKAVERGYQGLSRVDTDPALDPLREIRAFKRARNRVRQARREGFAQFRGLSYSAIPVALFRKNENPRTASAIVVALHGYGGRGSQTATVWREAAEKHNAVLLAPDALRPAAGGYGWIFQDEAEWWVLESVRRVRKAYGLESAPVILAGFSQGADVAMQVALKHPDKIAGVIAIGGYYEASQMPIQKSETPLPRFYLAVGKQDQPREGTYREAGKALKSAKAKVKLRRFSGGHEYPTPVEKELTNALKFVLKGLVKK